METKSINGHFNCLENGDNVSLPQVKLLSFWMISKTTESF